MKTSPARRSIGAWFDENEKAQFRVWAPLASQVNIFLTESEQSIKLNKEEYGYWHTISDQIKKGDLYLISLDGKHYPDPVSLSQPQGVHGPSQFIDLHSFLWSDSQWSNIPLKDYLLYELHTGTFTAEGTFEAIESKLPYLKSLGITAIELMPVGQFPGTRNWGYDGVFPFAVQHSYGGAKELQRLVNACHEHELAIVLDVVYNHIGPEGNYLPSFGHYFTDQYRTPWGSAVNMDDAGSDEARNYFIENALMWFRDFHVDALRLDAVHAIKDFSPVHFLKELREAVDDLMKQTGRTHYLIIECDLNDTRYIEPLSEAGYGMDAQWVDEFHHALRVTSGQETVGYYADFEGIDHLAQSYRNAYVYNGIYSSQRQRTFGTSTSGREGQQFIVFSQNHDHVGNRMLGERTSTLISFEKQKLLAGAVLISPYLPLLFMGEEYGEQNPFLYFTDHSDRSLIEAVREGRKKEFASFHEEEVLLPDPQSEETFKKSCLQWNYTEDRHAILYNYYRQLIALRKEMPVWHMLDRTAMRVTEDKSTSVLSILRWKEEQQLFAALNFSSLPQTVQMPSAEVWTKLIDSSDVQWGGPGSTPSTLPGQTSLQLPPESIAIYVNHYV